MARKRSALQKFKEAVFGRPVIDVVSQIPQRQLSARVRATLPQARAGIQRAQQARRIVPSVRENLELARSRFERGVQLRPRTELPRRAIMRARRTFPRISAGIEELREQARPVSPLREFGLTGFQPPRGVQLATERFKRGFRQQQDPITRFAIGETKPQRIAGEFLVPKTEEEALRQGILVTKDPQTGEIVGGIDVLGAIGVTREVGIKLGKKALQRIARSTATKEIFGLLKKKAIDVSDDAIRSLSRELTRARTPEKVRTVISNRLQGLGRVPRPKVSELDVLARKATPEDLITELDATSDALFKAARTAGDSTFAARLRNMSTTLKETPSSEAIREAQEVLEIGSIKLEGLRPPRITQRPLEAGFIVPGEFLEAGKRGLRKLRGKFESFKSLKSREVSAQRIGVSQLSPRKIRPVSPEQLPPKPQTIAKDPPILQKGQQRLSLEQSSNLRSSPEVKPLKEVLTIDKNITPKEKVNIIDFLRTPTRVLDKMGLGKHGEALDQAWTNYKIELPDHLNTIRGWVDELGTKESSRKAFRALDGQDVTLSPTETKVVNEVRPYLAEWAERLGLPVEKRVANYITRLFEDQFISKEFDPDLAKAISGKVAGSVYNPFLQKRLGKLGYREDLGAALQAYVKRATRKVHMDPPLAALKKQEPALELSQSKYVAKLTDRINMRPTDMDQFLDNGIKAAIGNRLGVRPTARLSQMFRMMTFRGTLGLNIGSAIRNLTQGVNTFAKLGTRWTAKGYMDTIKHMAHRDFDELLKNGVLEDTFIDAKASIFKRKLQKVDEGLFFFFEKAEQINRGSAYFGAKARALSQGKSLEQAIKEGVDLAKVTQFKFGPTQTPPLLQSDINKFLLQFQSFNIKQGEFLADMVVNKEWLAMGRYMVGAAAVTATLGKLIGVEPEDWIPFLDDALQGETRIGKTPTIQAVGAIGARLTGAPNKFGQPTTTADVGKALIPFFPGGTQIRKSIKGSQALQKGGSTSKTGRIRFPVTDPKSVIFGEFQSEIARFYFDNELTPLGDKDSAAFKSRVKAGEDPNKVFFDITIQRTARSQKPPEEKTKLIEELRDLLGIETAEAVLVTPPAITTRFESAKQQKETFKKVVELLDSGLAEEDINEQISALGVSQADREYFDVARLDNDIKTAFVKDLLETGTVEDLVELRREVNGKKVLTSGVIDELFNAGLVSKDEKKFLKSIVEINGTLQPKPTAPKKAKKPKKLPKIKVSIPRRRAGVRRRVIAAPIRAPKITVPTLVVPQTKRVRIINKTTSVEEFKRLLLKKP